jgi:carbamoylphosphate synthase large subunit
MRLGFSFCYSAVNSRSSTSSTLAKKRSAFANASIYAKATT